MAQAQQVWQQVLVTKFRVEAQSAAGLIHANIVNVYDVGDEDGVYYIVMELVEGITLKKYIEKKGRLGVREAVSIAIQVAQGIEAAHNHHIVHRDIKPQNIIIEPLYANVASCIEEKFVVPCSTTVWAEWVRWNG